MGARTGAYEDGNDSGSPERVEEIERKRDMYRERGSVREREVNPNPPPDAPPR